MPEWSGNFWESDDGDFGYMAVHVADKRQHHPPGGWRLVGMEIYEEDQCELYTYRRVSPWLMTSPATDGIAL